jgi:glutamate racemase
MHLLITDSGVGGLSVCAYAEQFLREHGVGEPVKLTYVNASPENDFGYNSMGSRSEKIEYFDRFLRIISDEYAPDSIYIACNTLSVLFADTEYSKSDRIPVKGIVETGVDRLVHEMARFSDSVVAIFGTPTTIEERAYQDLLEQRGVDTKRIIAQACPSLADTISEDRQGRSAKEKIAACVDATIHPSWASTTGHLTYLACTHYGYRKDYFSAAFADRGIDTKILNPNEFVIDDLFGKSVRRYREIAEKDYVDVQFITRYKIPKTALETIAFFLENISPRTIRAFREYTHAPDLF